MPSVLAAPVTWLGGSAVLAFNVTVLMGLVLTAWAGWRLVLAWTGSPPAALVAGALTIFNAHVLSRLPHAMAAHLWGVPLTLLAADRLLDHPGSRRTALALILIVAATAATSVYWLALAGLVVGAVMIAGLATGRARGAVVAGGAALAGVALALPVLRPYLRLAAAGGTRPLEIVAQFAATPAGYLTATSRLHAGWTSMFFRDEVNVFFAGVTAIALAAVGIAAALRAQGIPAARRAQGIAAASVPGTAQTPGASDAGMPHASGAVTRRRALTIVGLAAVGVFLSFGPATALYRWLYTWVPPLHGLRAPARFGYLYLLAVAVLAGFGVRRVVAGRGPWRAGALTALALALVTLEVTQAPIRTEPFEGIPPIYDVLARDAGPVRLVELPFFPAEAVFENGEYQLNATRHWRPIMNGTSGFTPMSYRRRAAVFWFFPREGTIEAMRAEGATHLMIHFDRFTPAEGAEIRRVLLHRTDLRLLAADGRGHQLYALR
ncbi:MAG: hypothetical protein R2752_15295 [Vicinamibacterales bacterium]